MISTRPTNRDTRYEITVRVANFDGPSAYHLLETVGKYANNDGFTNAILDVQWLPPNDTGYATLGVHCNYEGYHELRQTLAGYNYVATYVVDGRRSIEIHIPNGGVTGSEKHITDAQAVAITEAALDW